MNCVIFEENLLSLGIYIQTRELIREYCLLTPPPFRFRPIRKLRYDQGFAYETRFKNYVCRCLRHRNVNKLNKVGLANYQSSVRKKHAFAG